MYKLSNFANSYDINQEHSMYQKSHILSNQTLYTIVKRNPFFETMNCSFGQQ